MREDRRPSLWKSLKRALAGPAAGSPSEEPASVPRAEPGASVPPAPALPDLREAPPFLVETEPAVEVPPEPTREAPATESPQKGAGRPSPTPTETGGASAPPTRLARGLASFSRRNPEREKKFAHLLHDNPSDEKRESPSPGRRS
ncbi:MAG TPA: hypothetical protein VF999_05060 [Thermoanaerobaculia bacterium]